MQTAVVLKPVSQFAEPALVQTTESLDRMAAFMELIASRAYDIFENRGRKHGNDLEDWRHAEEELFHAAHVHLDESNDALFLKAEVAGFSCEDLEVSVEPRRVTITGRRASNGITTRKVLYCDACADRIFRALPLPVNGLQERLSRLPCPGQAYRLDLYSRLSSPKVRVRLWCHGDGYSHGPPHRKIEEGVSTIIARALWLDNISKSKGPTLTIPFGLRDGDGRFSNQTHPISRSRLNSEKIARAATSQRARQTGFTIQDYSVFASK